jgi:hypothetical protein
VKIDVEVLKRLIADNIEFLCEHFSPMAKRRAIAGH